MRCEVDSEEPNIRSYMEQQLKNYTRKQLLGGHVEDHDLSQSQYDWFESHVFECGHCVNRFLDFYKVEAENLDKENKSRIDRLNSEAYQSLLSSDYRTTLSKLDKILELDPKNRDALRRRFVICLVSGNKEEIEKTTDILRSLKAD